MKLSECNKSVLVLAIAVTLAAGATAGDITAANPALGVLSTVTAAQLPAKAAELVSQAGNGASLTATTIDVVKAAVGLNPAEAPAIVGSIAKVSPAMAATASATAVALVPKQVVPIARAAAAACPAKAGAIVEAICRVLPADYLKVAEAVSEVVPGSSKEILAGVAAAIPGLKFSIDQTLASYQGSDPSVSMILSQVAQTEPSVAALATTTGFAQGSPVQSAPAVPVTLPRGPSVGPPFNPVSSTPTVITPSSGGAVPTGGHGYAAP